MQSKRWQHPNRKATKAYIQEKITWEHLLLTKMIIFGLAGLKILAVKAFFALSVMIVTLFNVAPQYSKASSPAAGGTTSAGTATAGGDTNGGRGGTTSAGAATAGGDTSGGGGGATTAGGDTNGGTTNGTPTPPACNEGTQQGCATNLGFPCQQGIQTCQQGNWSVCRPVGQTEICTDSFDNDCDGSIDGQDSECTEGGAGCTDPSACNFNQQATDDDGSCVLPTGCNNRCPQDTGSPKQLDQCGVCGGDNSSCSDCSGTPNGNKLKDQCGACLLPNDSQFNACLDCAGTPNGIKEIDSCNNCLAPTDPQFNACKDCKGIQGGKHKLDQCGACLLPTDSAFDSCLDCAGVPFGQQKPGSVCNDGNPKTSNDTRAIDCSCAGSILQPKTQDPVPQSPTKQPPETPSQEVPTQETPQESPKTTTTITLVDDQIPTTPTIWKSSIPEQEKHESADVTPKDTQDDTLILPPDPPVRTSKVIRIPILTNVRQRLQACIQEQGNILGCLMQKAPESQPAPEETMCCTLPLGTTDWSALATEERVLIEQLQERNCLFRDDIGASIPTQGLETYITTQEVEHALFHLFGGNVLPQEDNEHRRYWLQAKEILPHDYAGDGGVPITYAVFTQFLQAGLHPWTTKNQFPPVAQNDHLVTRKEALYLFGEVSQFLASRNIDACAKEPLAIKRFPISKQQNDAYLACREQKSLSSCSYLLGLPTPKTDTREQQIRACEMVLGVEHPDCIALAQPSLQTQHASSYDCTTQQSISPSECASLVALYTTTHGEDWTHSDGWLQNSAPCTRYGVSCRQGNVTHLSLANNNLRGLLPELYFPDLQQVQLQGNALLGNLPLFPETTALEKLFLYDNAFVGTIPQSYERFSTLSHLYLGGSNQLCGTIPAGVKNLPIALAHTDIDSLQFVLKSCSDGLVCNTNQDCTSNACTTSHICRAPTEQKQLMTEILKTKAQQAGFTTQSLDSSTTNITPQQITTYLSCLARGHSSEQCQRVLQPKE